MLVSIVARWSVCKRSSQSVNFREWISFLCYRVGLEFTSFPLVSEHWLPWVDPMKITLMCICVCVPACVLGKQSVRSLACPVFDKKSSKFWLYIMYTLPCCFAVAGPQCTASLHLSVTLCITARSHSLLCKCVVIQKSQKIHVLFDFCVWNINR